VGTAQIADVHLETVEEEHSQIQEPYEAWSGKAESMGVGEHSKELLAHCQ